MCNMLAYARHFRIVGHPPRHSSGERYIGSENFEGNIFSVSRYCRTMRLSWVYLLFYESFLTNELREAIKHKLETPQPRWQRTHPRQSNGVPPRPTTFLTALLQPHGQTFTLLADFTVLICSQTVYGEATAIASYTHRRVVLFRGAR